MNISIIWPYCAARSIVPSAVLERVVTILLVSSLISDLSGKQTRGSVRFTFVFIGCGRRVM